MTTINATTTTDATLIQPDLGYLATQLVTLAFTTDSASSSPTSTPNKALSYISPTASIQHNDSEPTFSSDAFFENWTALLNSAPGPDSLRCEIKETCVDEDQRKVWVLSEVQIRDEEGRWRRKSSVDMLRFDESGVCVESVDWVRRIRDNDDEDDED